MTLTELLLATAMTAVVVGAVTLMYGFSMGRLASATASFASTQDAVLAADRIEQDVRSATTCAEITDGGRSGLKITMPSSGTDKDGDGRFDTHKLSSVTRRGLEKMGRGKRVWYYLSDNTGSFYANGTVLWRAERTDDAFPTSENADGNFVYVNESEVRYPYISSFDFDVDASTQSVAFTLTTSSLTRASREVTGAEMSGSYSSHSESRIAAWRRTLK